MTREELLAQIREVLIQLTDEQVAQLMEFIEKECGDDENQAGD